MSDTFYLNVIICISKFWMRIKFAETFRFIKNLLVKIYKKLFGK
jgi:hypothetical protein